MPKCQKCGATLWLQIHHLFPQKKWAKKLYGDLIHDPKNLQVLCYSCHLNKAPDKLTEKEFCDRLCIEVRSKLERNKK